MKTRLVDILRSLLFYAVFYGGTVGYVAFAMVALALDRARFTATVDNWSRFHRVCVERLLAIRVVLEGELPRSDAVIAMKHESFFEAIEAPNLVHLPVVIAKAELLRIPLWGKAGAVYGLIGVERDEGAKALRSMVKAARALMKSGRPLVIFPEGTRVPHGELAPLGSGFAGLYKLLDLPVVPVAVDSGPLYHRVWKRSGAITIRVGEVIPAGLPRDQLEARVVTAINALNPALAPPEPSGSA